MSLVITILIIILSLVLVGFGAYVVIGEKSSEEDPREEIKQSGMFSVYAKSPREDLERVKPSREKIKAFLDSRSDISPARKQDLLEEWEKSIQETVKRIEEGYANGVQTFRYTFTEKDLPLCPFLNEGNYITKEQIYNYPELLPPFYLGCGVRLVSKESWDNQDNSGWKPLLPREGKYPVPDWRQIALD